MASRPVDNREQIQKYIRFCSQGAGIGLLDGPPLPRILRREPDFLFMIEIELTQGHKAIIDECDLELVSRYTWHASPNGKTFYAETCVRVEGKQKTLRMHRLIMGIDFGDRRRIDHKNGDGLVNTMDNLRIATNSQNNHNARIRSDNTSGYRGVKYKKDSKNKWVAEIKDGDKRRYIGSFPDAISAARAYDDAAREIFGEFARTNF